MKIEVLHIGMGVRHPQYGLGMVEPNAAGLEPAEPQIGGAVLKMVRAAGFEPATPYRVKVMLYH